MKPVAQLFGLMAAAYSTYATILAFIGGTLWPIGYEISGGLGTGLLFIFIIDPILILVFYWASMILLFPIFLVLTLIEKRR